MYAYQVRPRVIFAWALWTKARCLLFARLQIVMGRPSPRSQKSPNVRVSIEQPWQNRSTPWNLSVISCGNSVKGKERANLIPPCMKSLELCFRRLRFLLVGSRPGRLPLSSSITRVVALDDTNKIQEQDTGNYKRACLRHGAPLARYSLRVAHA